jgi:hypothetical protein
MGPTLTCSFDHATVVEEELEAVVGMEEVPSGGLREERSRETEPVHELRHHRWVVRRRGRAHRAVLRRSSWPEQTDVVAGAILPASSISSSLLDGRRASRSGGGATCC